MNQQFNPVFHFQDEPHILQYAVPMEFTMDPQDEDGVTFFWNLRQVPQDRMQVNSKIRDVFPGVQGADIEAYRNLKASIQDYAHAHAWPDPMRALRFNGNDYRHIANLFGEVPGVFLMLYCQVVEACGDAETAVREAEALIASGGEPSVIPLRIEYQELPVPLLSDFHYKFNIELRTAINSMLCQGMRHFIPEEYSIEFNDLF